MNLTCTTKIAVGSDHRVKGPVGVLSLQGAFALHLEMLADIGAEAVPVRTAAHLASCERLIIPGGESTTIAMMIERNGLVEPLRQRVESGMPILGTCAGMILLADGVTDGRPGQLRFGAIDIDVQRNGYGRQSQSFISKIRLINDEHDSEMTSTFIRAPRVTRVGAGVEVLGTLGDDPVLCRQGSVLACAFHPELAGDQRVHHLLLEV